MLRLEVLDYAGPMRWRWRLTDTGGAFVADHQVDLDGVGWELEAFTDLRGYLRWNAAPDRRVQSEAELTTRLGCWITDRVLGPVAAALAQRRQPVRLEVPGEAAVLAYRPWELAQVKGRPLAAHRVGFITVALPHQPL